MYAEIPALLFFLQMIFFTIQDFEQEWLKMIKKTETKLLVGFV